MLPVLSVARPLERPRPVIGDEHRLALVRLGGEIRRRRQQQGLTQRELAGALAVSVAYVSLLERGRRNVLYTRVLEIARFLEVPASELLIGAEL